MDLKPDYIETRYALGLLALDVRDFTLSVANLRQIKRVTAEQALPFFFALAYASFETGNGDEARKAAERAKELAKTPEELERSEQMLRYVSQDRSVKPQKQSEINDPTTPTSVLRLARQTGIAPADSHATSDDARNPPSGAGEKVKHVDGMARHIDCLGKGGRIHVLVESNQMVFAIPDPEKILVKNASAGSFEFKCGPQKPLPVGVDYVLAPHSETGMAGIVRALEIK